MSNPLAIQAVTRTLRELLLHDDAIEEVSVRPPDRLVDAAAGGRLNLYLYRVAPNAAWQNANIPDRSRPSEPAFPPLALDLYYLLTAYGEDSEFSSEHGLLGRAMHIFHSNASLSPAIVRRATTGLSAGDYVSDLHEQIERIRITHDPLSLDDLSKLWNTFQTQYRISTAYRVSVVLIDSARPSGSALPVLRRGADDRGVRVFPTMEPRLNEVVYHHRQRPDLMQDAASLDSRVALKGTNLPGIGVSVTIRDPRLTTIANPDADRIQTIQPLPTTEPNSVELVLQKELAQWQGGVYFTEVSFESDGVKRTSNQLPFAIVPEIRKRSDGRPMARVFREGNKNMLQVEIINGIASNRNAYLILNGRSGMFQLRRDKTSPEDSDDAPVFYLKRVTPGQYRLRVRVDGVDSLMTMVPSDTDSRFPEFDPNMLVTV
jgi:hypothetical protein